MKLQSSLKNYFITGLLVIVPLIVTIWLAQSIVIWVDNIFPIERVLGINLPGLGILLTLALILLAGVAGRNFLGEWVVDQFSRLMSKIPFIGSVYGSLRQVMLTLVDTKGDKFGRAVLIEYPKENSWTIGFVTTEKPPSEIREHFDEDMLCVFVPTTPNPTSGFFMFVPKSRAKPLDITVDQAFKVVVSLGLVGPQGQLRKHIKDAP